MPHQSLEEEISHFNQAVDLKIRKTFHPFSVDIPEGKKIRAELCFLFSKHFGLSEKEALILAFAVEGVHTGSLLLDDMIDRSLFRRGKKALWSVAGHKKTVSLALLLLSRVLKEVQSAFPNLALLFSKSLEKMSLGESLILDQKNYISVCYSKTGVLFTLAAILPALTKGTDREKLKVIYLFSRHIGIAYQLKDDLMDNDSGIPKENIQKIYDYHLKKASYYLKKLGLQVEIQVFLEKKFEEIYGRNGLTS